MRISMACLRYEVGTDKRRLRNAGRDVGGKADVSALSHVIWELTGEFSRDSEKKYTHACRCCRPFLWRTNDAGRQDACGKAVP